MVHDKYTYNKNYNSFFEPELDTIEINRERKNKPLTTTQFIERAVKVHNMLIEYDGKQHFKPISQFGGEIGLISTIAHDKLKTEYALNNNINLLRIP